MRVSEKRSINENFKKVFDFFIEHKIVENKNVFVNKLGTYNNILKSILDNNGERCVSLSMMISLADKYGVNPNFLLGLSEKMFLEKPDALFLVNRKIEMHQKEIENLENAKKEILA